MAEAGGDRGTDEVLRPVASIPFHDDEETASAMMHVLVHVQDAHDVGAARGLPVVLHLLPGLGAVIQELGAGVRGNVRLTVATQGVPPPALCRGHVSSERPVTCPRAERGFESLSRMCGPMSLWT